MAESVTLGCPDCWAPLGRVESVLRCAQCGGEWPVVNGVPEFILDAPYWGEIDQDRMIEINEQIRTSPWKEVLLADSSLQVQKAAEMMMNVDRANWHMFLPLSKESVALDVGAGSGVITEAMASFYHHVIAVEPVQERIVFMQTRFKQGGFHNVTLIRSGVTQLPLPPCSVDLAILNGVLEWIPWSVTEGNPRDVQIQALRRLNDLLRPGGFLCVGIENRWTLDYFLGATDPHAEIPYVTILPRFLADWYARWKTGRPYRNYLYSASGYQSLFQEAGFVDTQVYCALPSYNHPSFIVPLDKQVFNFYQDHFNTYEISKKRRLIRGLLRAMGLDKHLVYSFFIIGRKPQSDIPSPSAYPSRPIPNSLIEMIEARVKTHGWCRSPIRILTYNNFAPINRHGAVGSTLLFLFSNEDRDPSVVVKLSREAPALEREYDALGTIQRVMKGLAPEPLFFDSYGAFGFLGMSSFPGKRLSTSDAQVVALPAVVERLVSCHLRLKEDRVCGDSHLPEFGKGQTILKAVSKDPVIGEQAAQLWQSVCSSLAEGSWLPIDQHGDFCFTNFLFHGKEVCVLDWEDFGEITMPAYDFFCLILNFYVPSSGTQGERFFHDVNFLKQMRQSMNHYFLEMGISTELARTLFEFTLIQQFLYAYQKKRSSADLFWERIVGYLQNPGRFSPLVDG